MPLLAPTYPSTPPGTGLPCVNSCHFLSHFCPVMLHHVMSCHVTSRHVASRRVASRRVASRHVTSCHVISYHVISYHFISCHVILCQVRSGQVSSGHVTSRHVTSCHLVQDFRAAGEGPQQFSYEGGDGGDPGWNTARFLVSWGCEGVCHGIAVHEALCMGRYCLAQRGEQAYKYRGVFKGIPGVTRICKGMRASKRRLHSGIRQGCPLSPYLFIM